MATQAKKRRRDVLCDRFIKASEENLGLNVFDFSRYGQLPSKLHHHRARIFGFLVDGPLPPNQLIRQGGLCEWTIGQMVATERALDARGVGTGLRFEYFKS
ncbi:hypothetical protein C8R45DRAFT_1102479 [Mycena sanguinolenta]|nr:hypothetical protein C8R45DRAFT_1102479 [Mycena sanguinolenta]